MLSDTCVHELISEQIAYLQRCRKFYTDQKPLSQEAIDYEQYIHEVQKKLTWLVKSEQLLVYYPPMERKGVGGRESLPEQTAQDFWHAIEAKNEEARQTKGKPILDERRSTVLQKWLEGTSLRELKSDAEVATHVGVIHHIRRSLEMVYEDTDTVQAVIEARNANALQSRSQRTKDGLVKLKDPQTGKIIYSDMESRTERVIAASQSRSQARYEGRDTGKKPWGGRREPGPGKKIGRPKKHPPVEQNEHITEHTILTSTQLQSKSQNS